ncbi:hypothetical protein EDC94DRAFT_598337 [Helicostylum pulchrum]|nr:hypothetical protein EDC94DRAFT_598337 [Helicostylum pulchrum]
MKGESILDLIFECCPLLKRLECSFRTIQSYKPKVSIRTSMDELVLISAAVHHTVLEQLSIQLLNLKKMTFSKGTFTKYNGKNVHRKKLEIKMPHTKFDKLYIKRQFSNNEYSDIFLKYSNEKGDKYFYANLKSDITSRFSDSSCSDYSRKYTCKTTYVLNIQCQDFRELVIDFGQKKNQARLLA